jgi:hypothetical protein
MAQVVSQFPNSHIFIKSKFAQNLIMLILYVALPILALEIARIMRQRFAKSKYHLDALHRRNYFDVDQNEKTLWPTISRKADEIIYSQISKQKTLTEIKSDSEFFRQLYNAEDIAFKLVTKFPLWPWSDSYHELRVNLGKLPLKFAFEEIKKRNFNIILGVDSYHRQYCWDLRSSINSGLVLGAQGSGKSNLFDSICKQLLRASEFDVRIILATGKDPSEDFLSLSNDSRVKLYCHQIESDYKQFIDDIRALLKEDTESVRAKFIQEQKNKWHELAKPELKLIFLDEAFVISSNPNWKNDSKLFSDLISLGRSYGHYVIVSSQGQRAEEFQRIGLDQDRFLLKIGSQVSTPQMSLSLYGDSDIGRSNNLTQGRMILRSGDQSTVIRTVFSQHINQTHNQRNNT